MEKYRRAECERQNRARTKKRQIINQIKADSCCIDCGEAHIACLQFHHLDPANKKFRINRGVAEGKSLSALRAEIEKCVVLCANCHAKRHWLENT